MAGFRSISFGQIWAILSAGLWAMGISEIVDLTDAPALNGYFAPGADNATQVLISEYAARLLGPDYQWSHTTKIALPSTETFDNATLRWTTYSRPTYQISVSPGTEHDLIQIVKFATQHKLPFLATGGRHGYTTTYGKLQYGLAIDLSPLASFSLDKQTGRFTVGPALRMKEIFEPLFSAGFDVQTGSAPCPSVIGVTMGGGIGRYQGAYGLLIDALVSARVVTASGEVVEVSKTQNPDLFWAIRGSGSNFGIVTSATYQAHRLTDDGDIFVGYYSVPEGREFEYFQLLESLQPLESKIAGAMLFKFNSTSNKTKIETQWVYKGRETAAHQALKRVLDFGLVPVEVEMRKWNRILEFPGLDDLCLPGEPRNLYCFNLKTYSAATYNSSFTKLNQFYAETPAARGSGITFEFFPNQAMAAVPSNETSFAWRESTGYVNIILDYAAGDEDTDAAANAFGREVRADLVATSGFPDLTVFVNYAHGDETLEQIYGGANLPRLAALKKKWDPDQAFNFNNGLPTSYP